MKIKTIKNLILLASLTGLPLFVLAQRYYPTNIPGPVSITTFEQITHILATAVNWLFAILMIVAVIYILLAAFAYLGSAGDPEKVKTAQNRLIYSAVAIGVGLVAEGITYLVQNFLLR